MQQQQQQARQDEIRQWERDWRETVTGQLHDVVKIASDTALVVRELQSDVKELMQWKADQDRRKNDEIEKAPNDRRADWALFVSVCTAIIYLLTFLAQHWR